MSGSTSASEAVWKFSGSSGGVNDSAPQIRVQGKGDRRHGAMPLPPRS
jgi:hypothetical protein